MRNWLAAIAVVVLAASPILADVTITSNTTGTGMMALASGQVVTYIKGTKMRHDSTISGMKHTSIIDASSRTLITLNQEKKEAETCDMAAVGANIQKVVDPSQIKVSMTPNGQTKQVLGKTCSGYDVSVTVPMAMGNANGPQVPMNMTMNGQFWVAKGAPGSTDYAAFWKLAAQNGMFFGNTQAAGPALAQAKSMTELYKAVSETGGLTYESTITMQLGAGGAMAALAGKAGGMSMTITVTAVSTDPIGDDKFAIPADYTKKPCAMAAQTPHH